MKKFTAALAFLVILSCKNDSVKPINGTEITDVEQAGDSTITEQSAGLMKERDIEKVIADLQVAIANSTPSNRKELLTKYLQYGPEIDGAVAESYANFAFEYEQDHTADFYSVLTTNDEPLLQQWAEEAASEVAIQIETEAEAEAFFQDLKDISESKAANLDATQKHLFALYHIQLEKAAYTLLRN